MAIHIFLMQLLPVKIDLSLDLLPIYSIDLFAWVVFEDLFRPHGFFIGVLAHLFEVGEVDL